jgi:hypothetical protein
MSGESGASRGNPVRERVLRTPPLTAGQVDRFLELIAEGLTRQEAARRVQTEWDASGGPEEPCHSTSSRWRRLYFADEGFRERYEEALGVSGSEDESAATRKRLDALEKLRVLERAYDEYLERALDPERGRSGSSNRALLNILTLLHGTFKPFLEARVRHVHSGSVGLFAQPVIDTAKLSLEEQRELIELERRRQVLIGKAQPDDARVPVGEGAEVVDAEFVELPALPSGE